MCKQRLSALFGANATGTHGLKITVVGKAKKPHALQDLNLERDQPVVYYHSKNAWFTSAIFLHWFHHAFIPAVKKFQMEVLKLKAKDVKAILFLDNCPAHPSADQLISEDGSIRVMYLPPNTISLVQPMDQGIISALKRCYIRRYLDKVLVMLEDERDMMEDTRGAHTLANIKAYNIKSALFNLASAWHDMKLTTLANCWKKLLTGDKEANFIGFDGFESQDFRRLLHQAGEKNVTLDDVRDWMDENETDPGYEAFTTEQIAAQVVDGGKKDSSDDEEIQVKKIKLSTLRTYVDVLMDYTEYSKIEEANPYYGSLCMFREIIIREQHIGGKQLKLSNFFAPRHPRQSTKPQPGPSHEPDP